MQVSEVKIKRIEVCDEGRKEKEERRLKLVKKLAHRNRTEVYNEGRKEEKGWQLVTLR